MLTFLLALATPAGSVADVTPRYLDANGVRAVYTRSVDSDGTVHLRGVYKNNRSRFNFKVKDGRVRGTINGGYYEFEAAR